jgi:hypothetical protein
MNNRTKDFKWRYQTSLNSDKGKMLDYLQNQDLHPSQSQTAMIMTALIAYYMPLVLYNEGDRSRETLELVLLDSVKAIANHLKFTCVALNVDTTRIVDVLCNELGGIGSKNFSQKLDLTKTESSISKTSEELGDFDPQMWNLAGIATDSATFE